MLGQVMTQPHPHVRRRLSLTSHLAELVRVAPWIGELAAEFDLPDEKRFAIELCLEEVLSNIVRHGYRGEAGHPLTVEFRAEDGKATFVVEDSASAFEPTKPADAVPQDLETMTPGGQGLRLLFRFADSVAYERRSAGNRVTLGFSLRAKA